MKVNRLDGVLMRNRKHAVADLALAAFFLMVLVFSGFAFGSELPKLSPVRASAPVKKQTVADDNAMVMASAPDGSVASSVH